MIQEEAETKSRRVLLCLVALGVAAAGGAGVRVLVRLPVALVCPPAVRACLTLITFPGSPAPLHDSQTPVS